jgi:hypothetical protein
MKNLALIFVFTLSWTYCYAQARKVNLPTNCNSFKTCYDRSTKTDIYRNKIRLLDGAIHFWKPEDTKQAKSRAYYERAKYLVREASGETGYKGKDVNLKVNHNKAYKETSISAAIEDLQEAMKDPKSLGDFEEEVIALLEESKEHLKSLK